MSETHGPRVFVQNLADLETLRLLLSPSDETLGRVKITDGTKTASLFTQGTEVGLGTVILDDEGAPVTSFGSVTEYTDGGTPPANPEGPTLLWDDAGTWKHVSDTEPLPVTASIDTTGLALETKQDTQITHLSAIETAVEIIDNLVKLEDDAHQSGDPGVMMLAVRQDSHSDLAADGDYMPPTIDAAGGLRVSIVAGAGSGGTAAADDDDFTPGTTQGTPAMGVYESTPTSVTDGDLGHVGITQTRALRTAVEGTVAVSNAALTELAAAIDTEVQVDIVGALPAGTNAIGKLAANSGVDIGDVDVLSSALPTGASTSAKQDTIIGHLDGVEGILTTIDADTGGILTAVQLIDNIVGSINGPGAPVIDSYANIAINLAAAANQSLVAAPGANKQIWVYGYSVVTSAAGSVSFQDEDDTALSGIMPLAANSGIVRNPSGNFAMPIWKLVTNKALEIDVVTAEVDGDLQYAIVSV